MKALIVFVLVFLIVMIVASLVRHEEKKLATRSCEVYRATVVKRQFTKIGSPPFQSTWECVKIRSGK